MASTPKEEKYARDYYRKNKKYRERKIEDRKEDAKAHKKEEAAYSREYYAKNPSYRKYKIAYATAYRKAHKSNKK